MKKNIGIFTLIIMMALIIVVIIAMTNKLEMYVSDANVVDLYDSKIEFKVESVTDKSLQYKITNNSSTSITYDETYEIERCIDGIWYKYGVEIEFIEVAYELKAYEVFNKEIIFGTYYGSLPKGKYRLLKVINSNLVSAEFEIN